MLHTWSFFFSSFRVNSDAIEKWCKQKRNLFFMLQKLRSSEFRHFLVGQALEGTMISFNVSNEDAIFRKEDFRVFVRFLLHLWMLVTVCSVHEWISFDLLQNKSSTERKIHAVNQIFPFHIQFFPLNVEWNSMEGKPKPKRKINKTQSADKRNAMARWTEQRTEQQKKNKKKKTTQKKNGSTESCWNEINFSDLCKSS